MEEDQTYHANAADDDDDVEDNDDLSAQESSDVVLDDASRVRMWVPILRAAERALSDSAVTVRRRRRFGHFFLLKNTVY